MNDDKRKKNSKRGRGGDMIIRTRLIVREFAYILDHLRRGDGLTYCVGRCAQRGLRFINWTLMLISIRRGCGGVPFVQSARPLLRHRQINDNRKLDYNSREISHARHLEETRTLKHHTARPQMERHSPSLIQ